ncbi:hypothetical protein W97_02072 [Coniosporium apollinis CBS 100218]|uniref:Uncharacterized protein n=1 Tax=Coniosporium apollinis (strain CBS 100218) TaxID=1168221 RepID=R7YLP9_CONA1|nr:uncharacterized protein W97_02072 [Coniosporium apollinis CBS 100218]EON62847.1 hypothetical protein W97_02072 [Coniosporium apollinis CBS 100218]
MGGRLSVPRGPEGLTETSRPTRPPRPRNFNINSRTVVAPLAALTMACLLFVYSRTSIRAAKLNAQKQREADGGQISWHRESMRRHGQLETVSDRENLRDALWGAKKNKEVKAKVEEDMGGKVGEDAVRGRVKRSAEEAALRRAMRKDDG